MNDEEISPLTVGACVDGTFGYMPRAAPARSRTPSSSVCSGTPIVARASACQLASARSSASTGTSRASARVAGAALEQQRIADREHPLGGGQREVVAAGAAAGAEAQILPAQLIQAQPSERDEQVIAAHAREPRQREPLEDALEAPLRRPGGVAPEGIGLGGPGPLGVGLHRGRAAFGVVAAPRPEREAGQVRRLAGAGRARQRGLDRLERVFLLERAQVGAQEAPPGGPLEILAGQLAHAPVEPRGRRGEQLQPPGREGDLAGQPLGVVAGAEPRQQLAAVAVLQRPLLAAHAQGLG